MKFIGIPRREKNKGEKVRSVVGGILLFTFVFVCVLGAESVLSDRSATSNDASIDPVFTASSSTDMELLPVGLDESLPSLANRSEDPIELLTVPQSGAAKSDASAASHIPYTVFLSIETTKNSPSIVNPGATPTPAETLVPPVETPESVHYYVIAELSVRVGPGTEYEKVSSLVAGDEVDTVASVDNGWKKLVDGTYVVDDYLSVTPPETELTATFYVTGEANVRSGPGTGYEVVKTLVKGDAISVVAVTSNGWYKTVKGTYVSKEVCSDTPPATPTPVPTKAPTKAPTPVPQPTKTPAPTSAPTPSTLKSGDTVLCKITFYGPQLKNDGSYSTTTATGTTCVVGTSVAADWRVFPKNSTIYIPGLPLNLYDGSFSDDGYYKVEDKGGDIQGYWIDIYVPSEEIADQLGTVWLNVTLQ
jgi:3D (Asp-Asp-Asp) domain-containing protein